MVIFEWVRGMGVIRRWRMTGNLYVKVSGFSIWLWVRVIEGVSRRRYWCGS